MADIPWDVLPYHDPYNQEVPDILSSENDSFDLSLQNISALLEEVVVPPSPHSHAVPVFDNDIQNINNPIPFNAPVWNFGNNASLSSNGGGGGSPTISLADHFSEIFGAEANTISLPDLPSQIFGAGGNNILLADIPSHIFETGGSIVSLPDLPSQNFRARGNTSSLPDLPLQFFRVGENSSHSLDHHPSHIFRAGGDSSINPVAEIFGPRGNTISLEDHRSQISRAGEKSILVENHPSQIFRAGGESSTNPLAEIFIPRGSTISLEDHPSQISRVGENSISVANHLSQIFRAGGESSLNPLAEIFEARKRKIALEDHPSQIFQTRGNSNLAANHPSLFFGSRGSTNSLADHPSQLYGEGGSAFNSLDDHPSHNFRAEGESSMNPLAEIFGARGSLSLEDHPSHIFRAGGQSSTNPLAEIFGAKKSKVSLVDHPSQIFRVGGESSTNPLAEIFGAKKSKVSLEDHPLQIFRAGGESSINPLAEIFRTRKSTISLEDHPSQIFRAGGELSTNPLAEIFEARKSSVSLEDHPSQIFRTGGNSISVANHPLQFFGSGRNTISLADHPSQLYEAGGLTSNSLDDHPLYISGAEGELSFGQNLNHNLEGFGNNSTLRPLPLNRLPRQPIPSSCCGCQVLREIFHANNKYIIKFEIHGKRGVICHAIQERRANVFHNSDASSEPLYESFDFRTKSLKEVKHFLTRYCEERKAEGYIKQLDPLQPFFQPPFVGMDEDEWEDVLTYPEEYIPEDSDVDDFDLPNLDEMERQPADKASSGNWKRKGPAKRPRLSLPEQRERAAKMKLEDLRVYFHLTFEEACEELRLSAAVVKRLCRKFGIGRWPGRKIKAISKMISNLQPLLFSYSESTRVHIAAKIESLEKEIAILSRYS